MRLGKFIGEYKTIIKLMQEGTEDEFGRLMRIICHSFFAFYWFLDNAALMCSFNLLHFQEY